MGTPASRSQLGATNCPEVGGVAMPPRHVLDIEAARMMHLARRLGLRLRRWLFVLADGELPNEDWRKSYELYERTVSHLLEEQRKRAVLKPSARPALTDEEADAELAAYVRGLPEASRAELLNGAADGEGHAADALVLAEDEEI